MKKTIQVLVGIAVLNGIALFQSCDFDKCGGEADKYFDVQGFSGRNMFRSSNQLTEVQLGVAYSLARYQLQLYADLRYYSLSDFNNRSGGLLYACDPLESGYKGSSEIIKSLNITSDSVWDADHQANFSLNDLFLVSGGMYAGDTKIHRLPVDSIFNKNLAAVKTLSLYLDSLHLQPPTVSRTHRFTVTYEQTNGEKYTATLPPITFK